jgi:hypothetical protein
MPSLSKQTFAALSLSTGMIVSGSAVADPQKFDGAWSVQLVASAGMCGNSDGQTLTVQEGRVRARGSGMNVSGQVSSSGTVVLALQKGPAQGAASGKLSGASGSGTWTVSTLGCSGSWTAQRQPVTARAF